MEDQDMKYDRVLDKLKKTEPVLDNADELTDRIMKRVAQTDVGAGRIRVMRISGILSGVAASALICLLAYETLKYPVSPVENVQSYASSMSYDFTILDDAHEKEKIFKTILKNRETQRMRKEQLMASFAARNKYIKSH